MKEFIDKLINELEKLGEHCLYMNNWQGQTAICDAISIVNELAEEYKADKVYQLAMMYAKNIYVYGVDVTKAWESAVQNHMALGQAYMRGRQDEINRFTEEYESWVIIDGQYCWQTCGATEHCKECRRLGNCVIDYYENMGEYINCSTDISTKSTDCSTKVSEMPTGWIPCSERLPSKEECGAFGSKEFQVTIPQHNGNKTISMHFAYETVRGKEVARWKWRGSISPWEVLAWKNLDAPYTEGE